MKYLSFSEGCRIQHAKNGGEKAINLYLVDGDYETEDGKKFVLECHGDFWHGNPTKYARKTMSTVGQISMGELFDHTLEKRKFLENHGYTFRCIWETDFDKEMEEDSTIKSFVQQLDIVTPL